MVTVKEWLNVLGFGTPFLYAGSIYMLGRFLEKHASPASKKTLAEWLKGRLYTNADVAALLTEVFDRIYSKPLWGWKAILRSAVISVILTVVVAVQLFPLLISIALFSPEMRSQWIMQVCSNILADYLALSLIRRWLKIGARHPIFAMMTGPIIGVALVVAIYVTASVARFSINTWTFHLRYFPEGTVEWYGFLIQSPWGSSNRAVFLSTLPVHLWLPILAIGILIAKSINYLKRAGRFSVWFIKDGSRRPFLAVCTCGAVVVFIVAAAIQVLRPLP